MVPAEAPQARASQVTLVAMPFSPYFDAARQGADEQRAQWSATVEPNWNRYQEYLAGCMKAAGFDYFPVAVPEGAGIDIPSGEMIEVPWLADRRELVEQYGYGVTQPPQPPEMTVDEAELENLEYVESLNLRAQAAYNEALTGHTGDYESYAEAGGCVAAATKKHGEVADAVPLDESWYRVPVDGMISALEALTGSRNATIDFDQMTAVQVVVEKDARLRDLDRKWSDCMAQSGLTRGRELWLGDSPAGPSVAYHIAVATGENGLTLPVDNRVYQLGEVPDDQQSLIGSTYEAEIALADFDCRAQTDYVNRYTQIQFDLETTYVAAHQAELDKLAAGWSGAAGSE
jgi:hypothetical protein